MEEKRDNQFVHLVLSMTFMLKVAQVHALIVVKVSSAEQVLLQDNVLVGISAKEVLLVTLILPVTNVRSVSTAHMVALGNDLVLTSP